MRKILLFTLFICCSHTSAQEKLQLDGYVKGYEGKVPLILNLIKPNHEADMVNEEVIYMVDGKFRIEKELEEPTVLSIRIRPEITEGFDPRSWEDCWIWVANKRITLIGEKGSFTNSNVTGYYRQDENEHSKQYVNGKLEDYRQRVDSLLRLQTSEATALASKLKSVSTTRLMNTYRLEYSNMNPNNYVSVYDYSWFVKWIPEMVPKAHAKSFYNVLADSLKYSTHGNQIKYYIDNIAVSRRLKIGDKPYEFSLPDSTGQQISLASLNKKVILLDFWSSGCAPCRKEHKNYLKLYNQFKHRGFEIVSVSQDRSRSRWLKAMHKDQMIWTSLWDEEMNVSKYTYLVSAIPDNYLIDESGKIMARNIYGSQLQGLLNELIQE
ncbi:MAG: hypothetical protein CMH44_00610 [Muricauda sp.]|nr:TlpA disulfide reductase family protein [uncultured Allomuricauda sp.]MAO15380.1 hypothetical protein [Allomuricauda sp.]MBC71337.1 hypothetical protein [Allomuricauda sp.]|tara:strand:+ start:215 stop:1354 length:1140 start_codon:yes stop_codon:yes gene_type:complete